MVLRKITPKLYGFYFGSCKRKGNHSFLKAWSKKIILYFQGIKVNVYKCDFGKPHYHIGKQSKKARNKLNYIKKIPKITLLHIQGQVCEKYWGYAKYE